MNRIIFSFGSNLGYRKLFINKAIFKVINIFNLTNINKSQFLENEAILPNNAPSSWNKKYLNLLLAADIDLDKYEPIFILKEIKKIEKDMGRKEDKRWSPRIIDIDILDIYGISIDLKDENIDLSIPHKEINNREFIQILMKEINE